ncbi:hypothetical protein PPACK8108_LOCUS19891 [Phakopsora pachyrhizi]|uniref:DM2 domain-containing protein n=1 Tax=Phakopsora pachyrhizi TaxID=170000 RepID=A0AAV0BF00_PHAPC|nr:hypothetical protein PPACK8108_LOCUS19891 [Phakopsora pachyrhizi]
MGIRATEELEVGEELVPMRIQNVKVKANDQQYARQRRDDQQVLIESWTMTEQQQSQTSDMSGDPDAAIRMGIQRPGIASGKDVGLVTKWRCLEEEVNCSCWWHQDGKDSWQRVGRISEVMEDRQPGAKTGVLFVIGKRPMRDMSIPDLLQVLTRFLDLREASLNEILDTLWLYIKKEGLRDPNNKHFIRKDFNLACLVPNNGSNKIHVSEPALISYEINPEEGFEKRKESFPGRELALGTVPHQVQGFISKFQNLKRFQPAHDKQTGCSRFEGILIKVFNNEKYLEKLTGLDELYSESEKWVDGGYVYGQRRIKVSTRIQDKANKDLKKEKKQDRGAENSGVRIKGIIRGEALVPGVSFHKQHQTQIIFSLKINNNNNNKKKINKRRSNNNKKKQKEKQKKEKQRENSNNIKEQQQPIILRTGILNSKNSKNHVKTNIKHPKGGEH